MNKLKVYLGTLWFIGNIGYVSLPSLAQPKPLVPHHSAAGQTKTKNQTGAKAVKFYQDATNYEAIGIRVLVNGLPIVADDTTGQGTGGEFLNPYLLDEPNHITLILTPLKGATLPPERASVSVQVLETSPSNNGKPGPTETVYNFEWKQKNPPVHAPSPINGTLPPVARSQPLNWQNAPKSPLAQADKAEINAQIKRLHDALETKNLAEVGVLLAAKTDNMALALGQPVSSLEASQRRFFEANFGDPRWRMKPINYDHLQYHPGAEGRVIQVLNPDGSDPLVSLPNSNSGTTTIPLLLARVNGHWTFVI